MLLNHDSGPSHLDRDEALYGGLCNIYVFNSSILGPYIMLLQETMFYYSSLPY